MPNTILHHGFNIIYDGYVDELTTSIKIIPILSQNKQLQLNPVEVTALWDTGATVSCIKPLLWDRLQINHFDTTGRIELTGVGGRVKTDLTIATFILTPCLLGVCCTS